MIIDPRKAFDYFDSNFILKKSTKGWWILDCPICLNENRKFAVHFHYGIAKCWVCGYKTNIVKFVSENEMCSYFQAIDILNNRTTRAIELDYTVDTPIRIGNGKYIEMPKGFHTLLEGDGVIATRARNYLTGRGFDVEDLDFEGFGYCNQQCSEKELQEGMEDFFGYILIPFKVRGRLVYYIGRDFIGNFLRYKNPSKEKFGVGKGDLLFNSDALNIYEECFLLEGWADAKTLGDNAMSSQGWSLSETQKSVINSAEVCKSLVLVPDAGKDGEGVLFYEKALQLACEFIDDFKIKVINLNSLEQGKDVNEIGRQRVLDLIEETPYLSFSEIMKILIP